MGDTRTDASQDVPPGRGSDARLGPPLRLNLYAFSNRVCTARRERPWSDDVRQSGSGQLYATAGRSQSHARILERQSADPQSPRSRVPSPLWLAVDSIGASVLRLEVEKGSRNETGGTRGRAAALGRTTLRGERMFFPSPARVGVCTLCHRPSTAPLRSTAFTRTR